MNRDERGRTRSGPLVFMVCVMLLFAGMMAKRIFADTYTQTGILNLMISNTDGAVSSPIWNARPITTDPSNAQVGDLWFNSAAGAFRVQGTSAASNLGQSVKLVAITDGTTITNPTVNTTFSTFVTFPANTLFVGSHVRAHYRGRYSTGATANTLIFTGNTTLNSLAIGTALAASPTGSCTVTQSGTNLAWSVDQEFVVRTVGASGTLVPGISAQVSNLNFSGDSRGAGRAASSTFDTTQAQSLNLLVKNASSDASMTLTIEEAEVFVDN